MRFLAKRRTKPKEFFCLKYSELIGLREEHYREVHSQLPFHTVDISSEFVMISFACPFSGVNYGKQFFQFGKRMDLDQHKEKIKRLSNLPLLTGDTQNNKIYSDVDSLSPSFNPCGLCEREMQCLFTSECLSFKPKNANNLEAIIKILQENGFTESKELYHMYVAYCEDKRYDEIGPQSIGELLTLLILLIPLLIFIIPWIIFSSLIEKFE